MIKWHSTQACFGKKNVYVLRVTQTFLDKNLNTVLSFVKLIIKIKLSSLIVPFLNIEMNVCRI